MTLDVTVELTRGAFALRAALAAAPGAVVAVVGPNGAGKSTLLQAIAGLIPASNGRIVLGDRVLFDAGSKTDVAAERRGLALVFHDRLLFPHLTARDNVAFGARCRGVGRHEAREDAQQWLERVGAADVAARRPDDMSGGQQQRVALARALATRPEALLLDEPLAAVDARGKVELRRLLADQLRAFGGPCVLVTHDPHEAMTLASRLVVLEGGAVIQEGTVADVAARPASAYAAELLGVNLYRGTAAGERVTTEDGAVLVTAAANQGPVVVTIHPRAVAVHRERPSGSPRNVWQGSVTAIERGPGGTRVRIDGLTPDPQGPAAPGARIVAEVTEDAVTSLGLRAGERVWVAVKAVEVSARPA